jgi:hypothetical protein
MGNREDACSELRRLQRALEALAQDLDAIERRPHWLLRHSDSEEPSGIESFIDHFAFAVQRSRDRLV